MVSGFISFWVGRWGRGEEGCLGDALFWVLFVVIGCIDSTRFDE